MTIHAGSFLTCVSRCWVRLQLPATLIRTRKGLDNRMDLLKRFYLNFEGVFKITEISYGITQNGLSALNDRQVAKRRNMALEKLD